MCSRRPGSYAGWTDQVAEPGSFFASVAGHIPVAIVRGRDGELRGFVNVCRHRGHAVVEGSGCRETLQCPYHAWTYGLDGVLRKAPRSEREPGFDPSGLSLLPVAVDTWGRSSSSTRTPRRARSGMLSAIFRPTWLRAASISIAFAFTRITSGSRR
jgi:nitrite reductase/ring-hydroxylating ferredoxin subunit